MNFSKSRGGRRSVAIVICLAAAAVAGCSNGAAAPGQVDVLVEQDIVSWALPSDAYAPPNVRLESYAVDLKARDCVEDLGVTYRVPRFDPAGPLPATSNGASRRLFNEDIASKFGYREDLDPRVDWEGRRLADEDQSLLGDHAVYEQWIGCQDTAITELGGDPKSTLRQYGFPVDAADSDPAVVEAAGLWRECMAPLGIVDLPPDATPEMGVAVTHLFADWGLNADVPPWEIGDPSAAEIAVATHDAQCRTSSGWTEARYQAEWNAELDYLTKNYRDLEAQRTHNQAQQEVFLATIRGVANGEG